MKTASVNRHIIITPPSYKKIEHKSVGNLVLPAQKFELCEVELLLGYYFEGQYVPAGAKIYLKGDSGLAPWAKNTFFIEGKEAILCPDTSVIAYKVIE